MILWSSLSPVSTERESEEPTVADHEIFLCLSRSTISGSWIRLTHSNCCPPEGGATPISGSGKGMLMYAQEFLLLLQNKRAPEASPLYSSPQKSPQACPANTPEIYVNQAFQTGANCSIKSHALSEQYRAWLLREIMFPAAKMPSK